MSYSYTPTSYTNASSPFLEALNLNRHENAIAALHTDKLDLAGGAITGPLTWSTTGRITTDFNIERDTRGIFTDRGAWITMFRQDTAPMTERPAIADFHATSASAGGVGHGHVGINVIVSDHGSVTERTVTNAVNNGSGLIRLTVTGHGYLTGARLAVFGVGGVPNANNLYTITVIDANTIDLQGSTFAGTYTSGGKVSNRGLMYGISSSVYPLVSRGGYEGTAIYGDDLNGITVSNGNGAVAKATDAIYISEVVGHSNSEWLTLFSSPANCDFGIVLGGHSFNYQIDLCGGPGAPGTAGVGSIRIPHNAWIMSRNSANAADVNMVKISAANQLELGAHPRVGNVAGSVVNPVNTYFASDEFDSGNDAAAGQVGSTGWSMFQGTGTNVAAEANHPGIHRHTSTTTAGQIGLFYARGAAQGVFLASQDFELILIVRSIEADADTRLRVGLSDQGTIDAPANAAYFEKLYADTSWFGVSRGSSTQTRSAAINAIAANTWYRLRIRKGASTLYFSVNGGAETQITTNLPATSAGLCPFVQLTSQTTTAKNVDVDYYELLVTGLAR